MNKKGIQLDLFFIVAALFIAGLVFVFTSLLFSEIKPELNATAVNATRANQIYSFTTETMNMLDYIFPALLVGLFLFLIVSSFVVNTHPVFFWASLLLLGVVLLVAPPLANAFISITGDPIFSDVIGNFAVTIWIFDHYPLFIIMMALPTAIVLFGKTRGLL